MDNEDRINNVAVRRLSSAGSSEPELYDEAESKDECFPDQLEDLDLPVSAVRPSDFLPPDFEEILFAELLRESERHRRIPVYAERIKAGLPLFCEASRQKIARLPSRSRTETAPTRLAGIVATIHRQRRKRLSTGALYAPTDKASETKVLNQRREVVMA